MECKEVIKLLIIIWTFVGLGLSVYLIYFPVFMKKNIAVIVRLLENIAGNLEQFRK